MNYFGIGLAVISVAFLYLRVVFEFVGDLRQGAREEGTWHQ